MSWCWWRTPERRQGLHAPTPSPRRTRGLTAGATTTYTYDAADELTLEDAAGELTTYAYDGNGNTVAWNAAGARTTLTWGYEDEVLAVETAGGTVTMTYDADHVRRKREDATVPVKYIYDGAQVLIETEHGETTHARYNLAPFGYGDLLSQRRGGGGGGSWRWYHYDALGSTRAPRKPRSPPEVEDARGILSERSVLVAPPAGRGAWPHDQGGSRMTGLSAPQGQCRPPLRPR